jgi:hypothetical protein
VWRAATDPQAERRDSNSLDRKCAVGMRLD